MKFLSTLILFIILVTGSISLSAAQTSNSVRDSVLLAYRPNSTFLLVDYKNNREQLTKIYAFVKNNVARLQQNKSHINIVSYIKGYQVGNAQAINNASIQASIARAEFKTKYNIPHSAITFSIDTTRNVNNLVRVDYIATPVPMYSNNAIYYTESSSLSAMQAQVNKYKPAVPYTNYWMNLAKLDPSILGVNARGLNQNMKHEIFGNVEKTVIMTQVDSKTDVSTQNIDSVKESPSQIKELSPVLANKPTQTDSGDNAPFEAKKIKTQKQLETPDYFANRIGQEVFGLKTNLLYWAVGLPNIEMEFYIGKQVSLNIEGAYSWGWFLPQDRAYFMWNAGGELRLWFKNDAKFNGHFMGVYGNTGQYDFKFGRVGTQGDYYGVGVTYGYLLPIKTRFHMEFSIGAGWANYSKLQYEHVDGYNFEIAYTPSKNYFGITKAKVACVWKF